MQFVLLIHCIYCVYYAYTQHVNTTGLPLILSIALSEETHNIYMYISQ